MPDKFFRQVITQLLTVPETAGFVERTGMSPGDLVLALQFSGAQKFFMNVADGGLHIYFEGNFIYRSLSIGLSK